MVDFRVLTVSCAGIIRNDIGGSQVQTHRDILVDLALNVSTQGEALVVGSLDETFLLHVAAGNQIGQVVRATGNIDVVVLDESTAESIVLPVEKVKVTGISIISMCSLNV